MSSTAASAEAILEKFASIVANSLRIDADRVVEEAYLDDLGAESLDLLEITMETEDAFNVLIAQKNILQTAQEVFGAGVLVQGDQLTDAGYALLRRRMPDSLWTSLPERPSVSELNRLFMRVETWIWMIGGLLEHTPKTCAQLRHRSRKSCRRAAQVYGVCDRNRTDAGRRDQSAVGEAGTTSANTSPP